MVVRRRLNDDHEIDDDHARIDWAFVHRELAASYWAADRDPALTERAARHALNFGIYAVRQRQIGYARVLSDLTFRAHVADLVIAAPFRGVGFGTALIETILSHPDLAIVPHWTLVTADAAGLYAKFGFQPITTAAGWMIRSAVLSNPV